MPRLGKKARIEWSFFIGEIGRRKYNELCRRSNHPCHQRHPPVLLECPPYRTNRETP